MCSSVLVKSIPISTYEDLNAAEQEMRRLLRSQQQRVPICMTSESYHQFRCSIISMLPPSSSEEQQPPLCFHLPQGLVIRVQKEACAAAEGPLLRMNLLWMDACYSSLEEQQVAPRSKKKKF